jgi:hypothetical protein
MRVHRAVTLKNHGSRPRRPLALSLPIALVATFPGSQAAAEVPARTAAVRAEAVAPLDVRYPAPMPQPSSAAVHLPPSGKALDQRFAAPAKQPAQRATNSKTAGISKATGVARSDESRPGQYSPPAQQSCTTIRTAQADENYKQAKNNGKSTGPAPDWVPVASTPSPAARYGAVTRTDVPLSPPTSLVGLVHHLNKRRYRRRRHRPRTAAPRVLPHPSRPRSRHHDRASPTPAPPAADPPPRPVPGGSDRVGTTPLGVGVP